MSPEERSFLPTLGQILCMYHVPSSSLKRNLRVLVCPRRLDEAELDKAKSDALLSCLQQKRLKFTRLSAISKRLSTFPTP